MNISRFVFFCFVFSTFLMTLIGSLLARHYPISLDMWQHLFSVRLVLKILSDFRYLTGSLQEGRDQQTIWSFKTHRNMRRSEKSGAPTYSQQMLRRSLFEQSFNSDWGLKSLLIKKHWKSTHTQIHIHCKPAQNRVVSACVTCPSAHLSAATEQTKQAD